MNWHRDYFNKTLKKIGMYSIQFLEKGYNLDGWYTFFEIHHPDLFAKYRSICDQLNGLWGATDGESMEKFKSLCNAFEQAYRFGVEKYVTHLKEQKAKRELQGTQVAMTI